MASTDLNDSIVKVEFPKTPGLTTAEWTLQSGPKLVPFRNQVAAATAGFLKSDVDTLQ